MAPLFILAIFLLGSAAGAIAAAAFYASQIRDVRRLIKGLSPPPEQNTSQEDAQRKSA